MKFSLYNILGIILLTFGICVSAPKPAIVPGPDEWTLNVNFEHPQQIAFRTAGEMTTKRFWYTIITLTNQSGRDVNFYPKCELMTDTYQIIPAGKGIPNTVFEKIKKRHESKYPFLELLERVESKILEGEDNTKDIAIIWPDFDDRAKEIKIFTAGLSNETAVINHPIIKDENGKPAKVFLRKTLELSYSIGGDPALRSGAKLTYKNKRWIMR